MKGFNVINMP